MKYFIFVLGCQMNVYDAQKLDNFLRSYDLKPTSEKEANIIFVFACSVRQSAVDRIYGRLKRWQGKKVIILGCILPHDKRKLKDKVEFLSKIEDLPKILNLEIKTKKSLNAKRYFLNAEENYISIMSGCDNFCTYCAVPYTRGREISRSEKEIIKEVKELVASGAKRIVLLGQNVNNFKPSFVDLLKNLIKIPGDFKIGFLTSNPWNFPDELIDLVAQEPKLLKEIHLPLQSGDDEILRKMNRHYTAKQYLALTSKLYALIPNLYLSTDIIVGFPAETKKAFENTVLLCKKAKFDKAYVAMYSPRPGTVSAKNFHDNVPQKEKKRRWRILDGLINKT